MRAVRSIFHGSRLRLRFAQSVTSAQVEISDKEAGFDSAAAVILPGSQGIALKSACDAFNAVMDEHEHRAAEELVAREDPGPFVNGEGLAATATALALLVALPCWLAVMARCVEVL